MVYLFHSIVLRKINTDILEILVDTEKESSIFEGEFLFDALPDINSNMGEQSLILDSLRSIIIAC